MTIEGKKRSCEVATNFTVELKFLLEVFDLYKRQEKYDDAFRCRQKLKLEAENAAELFDEHKLRKRARIAKELGLRYLDEINAEGLAWGKYPKTKLSESYVMVDTIKEEIIKYFPEDIVHVGSIRNGLAWVYREHVQENGTAKEWRQMTIYAQPIEDSFAYLKYNPDEKIDAVASTYIAASEKISNTFFDQDGLEVKLPEEYYQTTSFDHGFAWAKTATNYILLINEKGEPVYTVMAKDAQHLSYFDENFASGYCRLYSIKNQELQLYEFDGKRVKRGAKIKNANIWSGKISEGMIWVSKYEGAGKDSPIYFYDTKGRQKAGPFQAAEDFSEGLACVRCKVESRDQYSVFDYYYYIDKQGKNVFDKSFRSATSFKDGIALVRDMDGYWYMNKAGQNIFNKKFLTAMPFAGGVAKVEEKDTGTYYIDRKGKVIFGGRNA